MDPQIILILALVVGLVLGAGFGWFFGGRPVAEWRQRFVARDSEARDLDEKYRRAITELASASERAARADALADELAAVRMGREALAAELATLKANAANFAEQKRL